MEIEEEDGVVGTGFSYTSMGRKWRSYLISVDGGLASTKVLYEERRMTNIERIWNRMWMETHIGR